MLKYILFDLDGTLNNSGYGIRKSIRYALAKFNLSEPLESNLNRMIGPPLIDGFMEFYGLSREDAVKGRCYYREYYDVKGKFECEIYDGIKDLMDALSKLNVKLGVCTSKPSIYSLEVLEHIGIKHYFDFLEGASLDGAISEKEEIIKIALDKFSIEKESAIMIGDRKFDIAGAKSNGIKSIGVTYGFGTREELVNANADYIVDSTLELKNLLLSLYK